MVWEISTAKNEMTNRTDLKATSVQRNDTGVVVALEAFCDRANGIVAFHGLVVDDKGNPSIQLANRSRNGRAVTVLKKINDDEPSTSNITVIDYSNNFLLFGLSNDDEGGRVYKTQLIGSQILSLPDTWRLMMQIKTSRGDITIKFPIFDDAIQQVIRSCA